jgi:hypothetical protein
MTVFRDFTFLAAGPQVNAAVSSQESFFTMPAFAELDWTRFDVWAAVAMGGVAVVEDSRREACLTWLRHHDYVVSSIDFAEGIGTAVVALGEMLLGSAVRL